MCACTHARSPISQVGLGVLSSPLGISVTGREPQMSGPEGTWACSPFLCSLLLPCPQSATSQEEPSFHPNAHGKWSRFCTCSLGGVSPDLQLETWSPEERDSSLPGATQQGLGRGKVQKASSRLLLLNTSQVQVLQVSHPTCFPMVVLSPEGSTQRHTYSGRIGQLRMRLASPSILKFPGGAN